MKPRYLPCLLGLAAFAFSGCETGRSTRIQEKSAAYALFSDEVKARLAEGNIGTGDSADAVYIALGKPNSVTTQKTDQGEVTVWTYKNFVVGEEMSSRVMLSQPGQKMAGTSGSGGPGGRLGPSISSTAPSRGGPQGMTEAYADTVTLHVDLIDNRVVALRAER